MRKFNRLLLLPILTAVITLAGCSDDDPKLTPDEQLQVDTNNWLYDIMKEVYYWTDDIPENVDKTQDPEDLFNSLLSNEDRFSVIVPDYDALINSLSGVNKDAGYEFSLVGVEGTNDVVVVVLYVKEGSSAASVGLKRGDIIYEINGQAINQTNYRDVVPDVYEDHTITFRRYDSGSDSYQDMGNKSLSATVLAENPHLLDTIYDIAGKKVGYYVYNFFSPGPDNNQTYDAQMDQIFANFKSSGVDEMIVDLRYNSGGSVSSATNLGSLLGTGVSSGDIFYQNQWNELYQNYIEGLEDGDDILRGKFLDKAENIGSQINGELYVLTGSSTASASELIINGLDPYMNVTIIGGTTVGKNVGSIPLEDEDNPDNDYGILPIVFKIFNSDMYSGYSDGFTPTADNQVEDFQFPLKSLGDVEEPLLARAISLIDGSATGGRKAQFSGEVRKPIMTSLENKVRSNRLIFDKKLK